MRYRALLAAVFISGIILGLVAGLWMAGRRDIRYVTVKKRMPAPAVRKKPGPKVAVVMDDFGYNMNNIDEVFDIKRPITLSILPNLTYSTKIAQLGRLNGYEVILHLPLEPHREDIPEEVDTINSRMTKSEIAVRLKSAIESVPGVKGVSNHMGSKSTEEKELVRVILADLKKRRLYFLDSLTSEKSVVGEISGLIGERHAKRDIFLDNSNNADDIRKQVLEMRALAFKKGRVIAICHDRKNTVKVLGEMMPGLASEGIEFVTLSELVR
ncbi:MAG: divergent polysaccharide deacetylase family protein [Candidatus Omnitrophica bacterium]|nr:divergent polysaccharide deacetylase family protein [Candidatus Omnitrophota bacterium]